MNAISIRPTPAPQTDPSAPRLKLVPAPARQPVQQPPRGYKPSQRRQWWAAPHAMRPAVVAACARAKDIRSIEAAGRTAVVVHMPTLATVAALVGLLSVVDLVVVFTMVLRIAPRAMVFASTSPILASALERLRRIHTDQLPATIYSGAVSAPLTVRVQRTSTEVSR